MTLSFVLSGSGGGGGGGRRRRVRIWPLVVAAVVVTWISGSMAAAGAAKSFELADVANDHYNSNSNNNNNNNNGDGDDEDNGVSSGEKSVGWSCPAGCHCVVASTPGLVCVNANLSSVPTADADTVFIDLSGNPLLALTERTLSPIRVAGDRLQNLVLKACSIGVVHRRAFRRLEQLRVVDLSGNAIVALEADVFAPLTRLTELNLSENRLAAVADDWFADGSPLRVLNMAANAVDALHASVFVRLANLEELSLRGCALHFVDERAFDGLFRLRSLDLGSNLLTTLRPDSLTWLRELRTLHLADNPWRCDCDLQAVTVILLMRGFHTLVANLKCMAAAAAANANATAIGTATANATATAANVHQFRGPPTISWADVNETHPECLPRVRVHARKTILSGGGGGSGGVGDAAAQYHRAYLRVNASRTNGNAWPLSSHAAAAASTSSAVAYSPVFTVFTWCAAILILAVASYVGVYVSGKLCVCATTRAAAVAKYAAANVARKKSSSIVRRGGPSSSSRRGGGGGGGSSSECERALVDETARFRDHFYLVDEGSSDISVSLDV